MVGSLVFGASVLFGLRGFEELVERARVLLAGERSNEEETGNTGLR